MKRPRVESDPESDDEDETNSDKMDFLQAEHVTATQAIGDGNDNPEHGIPELPPPLSAEHAAIRADFEIITMAAMDRLYLRITRDITKSAEDTALAVQKTTDHLHGQIASMGARITHLQQQVLAYQGSAQRTPEASATTPTSSRKEPKKKRENQTVGAAAVNTDGNAGPTYAAVAATPAAVSAVLKESPGTKGWTTLRPGGQKKKNATPKLIPTIYPQAEREVTCHFGSENPADVTTMDTDRTYSMRQAEADVALRRVNSALVDNKDINLPPFIRARVTIRGSIIFTTSNIQNNIIYEDYSTIIMDALSYHGKCEKVEIGKRFSQFLLHGVPTHLPIPEISNSIATNYPQLVQGQTPRWLTPADRREHKANSTIVMTLTGNIKKSDIGRQYITVCNRECQLEDYISYGRSTQCRNCQGYGHPAALCRNTSRCAVCAEPHETKDHPCNLPMCKKGPACTHPPIRCANCNTPHKASDPNCPERIKLRTFHIMTKNTTNLGDATQAGVAE
jgi:hypothetical protein